MRTSDAAYVCDLSFYNGHRILDDADSLIIDRNMSAGLSSEVHRRALDG